MKLTVEMPWEKDLSVNHMRFGKPSPKAKGKWKKRRVRLPHVQAWMERLGWEAKMHVLAACVNAMPETDTAEDGWKPVPKAYQLPLAIEVDFRFPDKRRRDDHNYFFVIANSVAAGLGIDDKDIRISTGTVEVDRERPGFTITVEDSA